MHLCVALLLGSLSKIIADPLAPDLTTDPVENLDLTTFEDPIALLPADSGVVATTADAENSGSSGSDKDMPDPLGNQNGLNIEIRPNSFAAVKTDTSNSECLSGVGQTSNTKRAWLQCPLPADPIAKEAQTRADAEDAAFAEKFLREHPTYRVDEDAELICQHYRGWHPLPLCCRGRVIVERGTMVVEECVMYIEGRPRCQDYRRRFCCWLLGFAYRHYDEGIDCVYMFAHVD